jgi:ribosomal-protein-alanine N-acetyltransferase
MLCQWAFDVAGFHRIAVEHSTANPASCRVAAKAGFHEEGIRRGAALHANGWHDMHVHALLADSEVPPGITRPELLSFDPPQPGRTDHLKRDQI